MWYESLGSIGTSCFVASCLLVWPTGSARICGTGFLSEAALCVRTICSEPSFAVRFGSSTFCCLSFCISLLVYAFFSDALFGPAARCKCEFVFLISLMKLTDSKSSRFDCYFFGTSGDLLMA